MRRTCLYGLKRMALCAVAIAVAMPVAAAPTASPEVAPTYGNAQELGKWAAEPQKGRTDGLALDKMGDVPPPAKLLEDHLALPQASRDSAGRPILSAPTTAPTSPQRSTAGPGRAEPDDAVSRLAKEAVRPMAEDLSNSAAAQAARDLKANLGLKSERPPVDDSAGSPGYEEAALARNVKVVEQMVEANNRGDGDVRSPFAHSGKRSEPAGESGMDKFVREFKPWALGLLGLYALAFIVKIALGRQQGAAGRRDRA